MTSALWLTAALLGALVMRDELDEIFDSALQETAQRLTPLVVKEIFAADYDGPRRLDRTVDKGEEYLTYQVRDASGAILLRSHDAPANPFEAPVTPGFFDTPSHRVYTAATVSGTIIIQVADPLAHRREAILEGTLALLLPLLFLVPVSVAAIWLIVSRAMRPIETLSGAIAERSGTNLAPLEGFAVPTELERIRGSVDGLLSRLQQAIDSERSFSANSAHELRTPLAGALAQTQRLLAELDGGAARERARQIEHALHRLTRLTEKLLQLARAEAGIGKATDVAALEPVVDLVANEVQRGFGDLAIRIEHGDPGTLRRAVDVDAFAIALRNLMENAVKYRDSDTAVTVSTDCDGVSVVNSCRPMAAGILKDIRQPFRRASGRGEGSGLGLAIADALAKQMGASLELLSPAPGRVDGFCARIAFGNAA
ncbi:MAG: sensor histidine kinase N-terminal domain-containing protein [Hyphomicrobiales bacterium]|nr:sensor histidine kinase N-terminal domain-containing protein [Hyphomicrobiales bacterium]